MLPNFHLITAIILAITVAPFVGWYSLAIFFGAYFIDVDHYFVYVKRKKDFSVKNAYSYWKDKVCYKEFMVFHTIEIYLLVFILGLYHPIFLFLLFGMMYHEIFDLIEEIRDNLYGPRYTSFTTFLMDRF